jgi:hypothetical protein
MKKAGIILLIMIFLFQAMGAFLLFKLRQNEVKQEIKSRIKAGVPEAELTVFKFNDQQISQLRWEDEHEFILDGQMYDIVKTHYVEGGVIFHCLHDKQETALFKNLNKLVANKLGSDQNRNNGSNQAPVNWYFVENKSTLQALFPSSTTVNKPYGFSFDDPFIQPSSPPPQL